MSAQDRRPSVSTGVSVSSAYSSASPSPSPALSAYSATSSDYDSDLNSLSLDDWGINKAPMPGNCLDDLDDDDDNDDGQAARRGSRSGPSQSRLHRLQALSEGDPERASGASTPTAARSGSFFDGRSQSRSSSETPLSPGSAAKMDEEAQIVAEEEEEEMAGEGEGFDAFDEDEEDMHASGIPAARGWRLSARLWETQEFRLKLLRMLSEEMKLAGWRKEDVPEALAPLTPDRIKLKRISGAFSNAVFFVSYPGIVEADGNDEGNSGSTVELGPPTVLLRVYGSGTEVLLSRRAELLILHTLSSLYEIGPHILGTFANGRVEEYFDCEPIGKEGLRDLGDRQECLVEDGSLLVRGHEGKAQWVARRMRELHEVPIDVMRNVLEQGDLRKTSERGFGRGIENHLFARSHRPIKNTPQPASGMGDYFGGVAPGAMTSAVPGSNGAIRESPAPMTPGPAAHADTSIAQTAVDGARAQAMAIRGGGYASERNASVASFDSLATSFNSQASFSSTDSLSNRSPAFGPSPALTSSSYYNEAARRRESANGSIGSPYVFSTPDFNAVGARPRHTRPPRGPYPGVWRRTKRWSREAAKVLTVVADFACSREGRIACAKALGRSPDGPDFNPFSPGAVPPGTKRVTATELGPTSSLRNTLLAIEAIDFAKLVRELDAFKDFVRRWERKEGQSKRVMAHNDAQYGNLLIRKSMDPQRPVAAGMPRGQPGSATPKSPGARPALDVRQRAKARLARTAPHERLVVIDFEYASPNPRAYDIANYFNEWRMDYHHLTDSWSATAHGAYPCEEERRRWLRAYVEQGKLLRMRGKQVAKPGRSSGSGSGTTSGSDDCTEVPDMALPPPMVESSAASAGQQQPTTPGTATEQIRALEKSNGVRSQPGSRASSVQPVAQAANGAARSSSGSGSRSTSRAPSTSPSKPFRARSAAAAAIGASPHLGSFSPSSSSSPQLGGGSQALARLEASIEREIDRLEREIKVWGPAPHAVWGLWGITFAKDGIVGILERARESCSAEGPEVDAQAAVEVVAGSAESFDELRYSLGRIELFRQELRDLGVVVE